MIWTTEALTELAHHIVGKLPPDMDEGDLNKVLSYAREMKYGKKKPPPRFWPELCDLVRAIYFAERTRH